MKKFLTLFFIILTAGIIACGDDDSTSLYIDTVATPTDPESGLVSIGMGIILSTATDGAEIWCTTNGSTPSQGGTGSRIYVSPILIFESLSLKPHRIRYMNLFYSISLEHTFIDTVSSL